MCLLKVYICIIIFFSYFLTDLCKAFSNVCLLQAKLPSAIDSFNKITANWQGKTIALFLDYDGTLSPIVDNPDEAYMSSEVSIMKRKILACCLIFVDLSCP